jgi:hypothetical protein
LAKTIWGRRQITGIPVNRQKPRGSHRRYDRSEGKYEKVDGADSADRLAQARLNSDLFLS